MSETTYLTHNEAARLLRYRPQSLRKLNSKGKGPPRFKVGGRNLYRQDELEHWVESKRQAAGR